MKTIVNIDVYGVKATYSNYEEYEDYYTCSKILSIYPTFEEAKSKIFHGVSIGTLEKAGFGIYECFDDMADQILFGYAPEGQNSRIIAIEDCGVDSTDINEVDRTITFNPDGCEWHKFDISLTIEKLPMTIINVDAFMEELK